MTLLAEHPTVKRLQEQNKGETVDPPLPVLEAENLRQLCLNAGADDVGFVALDQPELTDQRDDILHFFPHTKTLISFVCRMNREPIRNPARSVANIEFHQTGDHVNDIAVCLLILTGLKSCRRTGVRRRPISTTPRRRFLPAISD